MGDSPSVQASTAGDDSELWGDVGSVPEGSAISDKTSRLVEWHVDYMTALLQRIAAQRQVQKLARKSVQPDISATLSQVGTVLDEVKEVISLPKFDSQTAKKVANLRDVTISDQAILQLRKYVTESQGVTITMPFTTLNMPVTWRWQCTNSCRVW
jgi:nucleoid-associated protein YejK